MIDDKKCHGLLETLSDYVDGTLKDDLCRELERHLASCQNCRIVVDTLQKTIYLYHETSQSSGVPDEVRERLYHRLDLDDLLNK